MNRAERDALVDLQLWYGDGKPSPRGLMQAHEKPNNETVNTRQVRRRKERKAVKPPIVTAEGSE